MDNEFRKFVSLVKELRLVQARFFRTRDYEDLRKSKALEKRVDAEVARIEQSGFEKIGLFE